MMLFTAEYAPLNGIMLVVLLPWRERTAAAGGGNLRIAEGRDAGVYPGRPEDTDRNAAILKMLQSWQSWNTIISATSCSRSVLARLAKRLEKPAA